MLKASAIGILWAVSLAGLFAAGVSDFRHRTIPNRMVALVACCGVALRLISDPRSIAASIGAAVAVLLLLGVLAHQNIVGGGDAKLIAAVTLLVPPSHVVGLLLWIAIGGGVLSALYLSAHLLWRKPALVMAAGGVPQPALHRMGVLRTEAGRIAVHRSVPYGLATFAGTAAYALSEALQWHFAIS
jgi:prepilin peptidase CpaA